MTHPLDDLELQADLIRSLASGLKPRWVAKAHDIAPDTLFGWLDAGARSDAVEPFRAFCTRWNRHEAELMQGHVDNWRTGGPGAMQSKEFLERRWPTVWGKDAAADYECLQDTTSNAEQNLAIEEILVDPAAFGLLDLFEKHDRLTLKERAERAAPPGPSG